MTNKYLKSIALYSHYIVGIAFWSYFLFYVFTYKKLPIIYSLVLFLLMGIYIGYIFARWSIEYLQKGDK